MKLKLFLIVILFLLICFSFFYFTSKPTGYFQLIGGVSIFGILISLPFWLIIKGVGKAKSAARVKRKKEEFTQEYWEKRLMESVQDVDRDFIEKVLIFKAGEIAAYLKMRGTERGTISPTGHYEAYERFFAALRNVARYILETRRPSNVYLLELIVNFPEIYMEVLIERLAFEAELCKKFGFYDAHTRTYYIPTQALKRLKRILERYVGRV